ncbi:MAG: PEP/pyruvate-binding domain-containing protein [Syntrophomonadaceae bacterium]|nr:PEP/pyruvate-binding domain-containing protein [Syntrophomonadaceae bacterium]
METARNASLLEWPEAWTAGADVVGGKGWNLARLDRYGFTVPKGIVLTAPAYQDFIANNDLIEATARISHFAANGLGKQESEAELRQIRERIESGRILPSVQEELLSSLKRAGILEKALAIRSSATSEDSLQASFAGIHHSFLNIRGLDNVILSIKRCYASLWTAHAVAYRRKMNITDDEVLQAVLIMEMVDAQAAGVSFSCDPRNGRENIVLITANFGLGESVVDGRVQADEYLLDSALQIGQKIIGRKEGKTVVSVHGGTEFVEFQEPSSIQVLSDKNINRLGLLTRRVYDALGAGEVNQDVEWVFDGKDFILVQARPVTALPRYTFDSLKNQSDIWSNANLRDALPMVQSTLNWSLMRMLPPVMDHNFFGLPGFEGLKHIKLWQGRMYFNLSLQQWILFEAFGISPRQTNESLGGHQPEIEIQEKHPYRGLKGCRRIGRVLKLLSLVRKNTKKAQASFARFDAFNEVFLKEDLTALSQEDLLYRFAAIMEMLALCSPLLFACNMAANSNPLIKFLDRYFPGRGKTLAHTLMIGKGKITSAEQGYRLLELAAMVREDDDARSFFSRESFEPLCWDQELPEGSSFKQSFLSFLHEYGHRGIYEMDIINPRWREDPAYLLNLIRSTIEDSKIAIVKERQKEEVMKAWGEVKQRLPAFRYRKLERRLEEAIRGFELREMAKSEFVKLFGTVRCLAQEIGQRLAAEKILKGTADVYQCTWSELLSILQGDSDGRGLQILVEERKLRRAELEILSPPDYIVDEIPKFAESFAVSSSGHGLQGLGVSAGRASGPARLIRHPDEGARLQFGDVLVTHSTDPGWTPLFIRAAAIVVETGGAGSHGSIVAREYGIPAVVNIPGIMRIIKDGKILLVDGNEGKVDLQ